MYIFLNKLKDISKENLKEHINMDKKMFCFQCQETVGSTGCTQVGVCGKKPEVASLQDLLVFVTKGISEVTTALRSEGKKVDKNTNIMVITNLFVTITNANFNDEAILDRIVLTLKEKNNLINTLSNKSNLSEAAVWSDISKEGIIKKSLEVGVLTTEDEDIRSLRELILYGIKGISAYMKHANVLGHYNEKIDEFVQSALAKTLDNSLSIDDLLNLTLETGKNGVETMALLDNANTETYGNPQISNVKIGVGNRPGILISGHDLKDMEMLLKQSEKEGIDIYTHSEMLPANYYPSFKKYKNFYGNYGNAWWQQKDEFESFNGPIIMTTNCIVPPKDSYKDRLFTTGTAGYPGCKHIKGEPGEEKDFTEIIEMAKKCSPPTEIEKGEIVGGFAHNQVVELADKIVDAVKSGKIKKFVVMAGCDGRSKSRKYYTDFAEALPEDTVILTAGCAKFRYNKLKLGEIGGIPRVLDAGQCNDSYSLAVTAIKLKEIFGLDDINDLPIIYNIAWYEQKAVIVFLSLLYLGIKNIHLGPTLPAFLSPNVAKVIVEKFKVAGIGTVKDDMKLFFGETEEEDKKSIISKDMTICDVLSIDSGLSEILVKNDMTSLDSPSSQMKTLGNACLENGVDADKVSDELNKYLLKK